MSGFACRIDYTGHRSDVPSAPEVSGTARIGPDGFSLDEHAPNYTLHADAGGVVVRAGATMAQTTDPFGADALVNPWALALAALSHGGLHQHSAVSWQTPNGVLVYFDPSGAVAGLSNARDNGLALTFSGWSDIAGVPVPTRIVRLRQGTQVATFQIDRLTLVRDAGRSGTREAPAAASLSVQPAQRASARNPNPLGDEAEAAAPAFPLRIILTLFGMLSLAVAVVAWFHRDAFTLRLCAGIADDPRGWRSLAIASYVSPDGVMLLEGNRYRVGPEFFARAVEVQHSALFVRVSAPGLSKTVVLPRRLPRVAARHAPSRRAASAGLSLIETLFSISFFTVVIVVAVYPALTAVARADYVAAQKRAALAAVANALTDEEMACAYGTATPTGTTTTSVNGMTVTIAVTDSTVAGARDIAVSATDASGLILAQLATTVGPPVPAPGAGAPPAGTGGP
jgi:Tfp pilus assembly protein PilV